MRKKIFALLSGALIALALISLMGPTGGFPSRPRFLSVGVGTTAPAGNGNITATNVISAANISASTSFSSIQYLLTNGAVTGFLKADGTGVSVGSTSAHPLSLYSGGTIGARMQPSGAFDALNGFASNGTAALFTAVGGEAIRTIATDAIGDNYIQGYSSDGTTTRWFIGNGGSATNIVHIRNSTSGEPLLLETTGGGAINANGSTIWTAGNDGPGSGLDADTLDGVSSAALNPIHVMCTAAATCTPSTTTMQVGQSITAYKNADTSTASDATVNPDPNLVIPLGDASGSRYLLEGFLKFQSASATPGWSLACTNPSGTAVQVAERQVDSAGTVAADTSISCGGVSGTLAAGLTGMVTITGEILKSAANGDFTILWAQGVSNATATTLQQGSWIRVTRIL